VNFFDADRLAGKDRAEVNLFVPQTDPDAMGDENSLSDQTASLLKLNKACAEARGTPLTLRMLEGRPRSSKSLSNTVRA
jgi:hypothetical protein